MAGQEGCLQEQDRSAVTHPNCSHARRCLILQATSGQTDKHKDGQRHARTQSTDWTLSRGHKDRIDTSKLFSQELEDMNCVSIQRTTTRIAHFCHDSPIFRCSMPPPPERTPPLLTTHPVGVGLVKICSSFGGFCGMNLMAPSVSSSVS
ncbi:hypothetical protein J6590_007482 [Homalodisca vitripennis]|nr:hypothetical protein J6590_007482 [Homalodisca vitripennis]